MHVNEYGKQVPLRWFTKTHVKHELYFRLVKKAFQLHSLFCFQTPVTRSCMATTRRKSGVLTALKLWCELQPTAAAESCRRPDHMRRREQHVMWWKHMWCGSWETGQSSRLPCPMLRVLLLAYKNVPISPSTSDLNRPLSTRAVRHQQNLQNLSIEKQIVPLMDLLKDFVCSCPKRSVLHTGVA